MQEQIWSLFESQLFSEPSRDDLFNPYAARNERYDLPDAVQIRQDNLRNYLAYYKTAPRVFILAEAPGPWGCRFSGVPLVSEAQLMDAEFPIQGRQSSTADAPHSEYSAGIYWRVLQPYFPSFFTWNSVPFHPHKKGIPLSIRTPAQREVAACAALVSGLLDIIRPDFKVAVGRKAEYAFRLAGSTCTYVRHPSQGGARLFEAGINNVFCAAGLAKTF